MRMKIGCATGILLCAALLPVPAASQENGRGFVFYENFQGSANTDGAIAKLDTTIGYNFNQHFGWDVGIPIYFVNPSETTSSTTGTGSTVGIGNLYSALRLRYPNPTVNFLSVFTVTAPTGDREKGLSTGHATFDWTNYFNRTLYSTTLFANIGIANTVSDTNFFLRPFTSKGFLGHFGGGAELSLNSYTGIGASAYAIVPSGEQTLVSRVVPAPSSTNSVGSPMGRGVGLGLRRGNREPQPFETVSETTGASDLAKDHGFSLWVSAYPSSAINLYIGYNRSVPYAFNTVFFGAGFNLGSLARQLR
ncbi:MAG: hypothetical protein HY313_01865 [Acidobacteria bacterium]|nr:hypothetical protein [Acidobacteriota bacterium]